MPTNQLKKATKIYIYIFFLSSSRHLNEKQSIILSPAVLNTCSEGTLQVVPECTGMFWQGLPVEEALLPPSIKAAVSWILYRIYLISSALNLYNHYASRYILFHL